MKLYIEKIGDNKELTRKQREDAAIEKLVAQAFGTDARKSNLPTGEPIISIQGKPVEAAISISHSKEFAVLAVDNEYEAIGVDAEEYRCQLRRVVPKFLSAEEAEYFTSDMALLRAWTLKEATYKAARTPGLALVDIRLSLNGESTIKAAGKEFTIIEIQSLDGSIISVVAKKVGSDNLQPRNL